jgi:hypothetical protein
MTEQGEQFVSFRVDGVRERDIDQFDELCAKLVSGRGDRNKIRKDGFYFSLFHLRQLDDMASRQLERIREEVKEIVKQELASAKIQERAVNDEDIIKSLKSLDDAPTEEPHVN